VMTGSRFSVIDECIARRIRAIRRASDATQDDVATAARSVGIHWTRPTVCAIENCQRKVQCEEFLLLSEILWRAGCFASRDDGSLPGLGELFRIEI
jgi:hypothetical protein